MTEIKEWESNIFSWAESYLYTESGLKSPLTFVSYLETLSWSFILYNNVFVLEKGIFIEETNDSRHLLSKIPNYSMKDIFFTFMTDLMNWLYCTIIKI